MSAFLDPIVPDYHFIFKPDDAVEGGGCHVDVWLPNENRTSEATRSSPVALMFHGGGFWFGSTTAIPFNQVAYLLAKGVAVVSAAYRFRPHVSIADIREDALDAYKYIQHGINVDLKRAGSQAAVDGARCCCFGYSAGGSITVYVAAGVEEHNKHASGTDRLPDLCGIVPVYPFTDYNYLDPTAGVLPREVLELAIANDPVLAASRKAVYDQKVSCDFMPYMGIGGSDIHESNGHQGPIMDQSRWLYQIEGIRTKAFASEMCGDGPPSFLPCTSPNDLVTKGFPPAFIVSAEMDELLDPSRHCDTLRERLLSNGVVCELALARGMKHGEAECFSWMRTVWEAGGEQWWEEAIEPSLRWALQQISM